MKAGKGRPFKNAERDKVEREIEEELRFHLEMLTEEQLRQDLSFADARNAALERFGDVERVKNQCVEISKSGHPLMWALRAFLIPVFLAGVLVRVFNTELDFIRVGDTLMMIAVLGRLLLYLRGLHPSSFREKETTSPLMLNERLPTSVTVHDQRKLTPVERVISDK